MGLVMGLGLGLDKFELGYLSYAIYFFTSEIDKIFGFLAEPTD
jgi:hypothetical protein